MKTISAALLLCLATALASAQTPQNPPSVRLRGTLTAVSPTTLTLKERGGQTVNLVLPDNVVVQEVYPIALEDIRPGSYVGVGGLPLEDGSQRAIAVTVFPESARGTGDGHRPFDLSPESTMTNATVADLAATPQGRRMQLKYKDGEKTIIVPPGTPVVTFKPGDRGLLVTGASVSLTAQEISGKPTATRINAGRNGFPLPY